MTALLIRTTFEHPPIPDRSMDWSAIYDDYDADGDSEGFRSLGPIGHGRTEAEAVLDLFENNPRVGAFCKCARCKVDVLAAALRDPARCTLPDCPVNPWSRT